MAVRNIRILIIEDSPTVRNCYRLVFEIGGFEVLEAETAGEGWKLILKENPDILVLDLMLPDEPGINVLKKVRASEFSKDLPVIVLTSVSDIETAKQIMQCGANYYIVKGSDSPEMILDMIYTLLKERNSKQQVMEEPEDESVTTETDLDKKGADEYSWKL